MHHRIRGPAGGTLAVRGRIVAAEPERPSLIVRACRARAAAAAAAAGARRRGRRARLDAPGPFGGEGPRRLHLGPRRAGHEGRRGDDAPGLQKPWLEGGRAPVRRAMIPCLSGRRGGRQPAGQPIAPRVSRALRAVRGCALRDRRVRRLPDGDRRAPVLPDRWSPEKQLCCRRRCCAAWPGTARSAGVRGVSDAGLARRAAGAAGLQTAAGTPAVTRAMVEAIAAELAPGRPAPLRASSLVAPRRPTCWRRSAIGAGCSIRSLHNTVSASRSSAAARRGNVIPDEVSVELTAGCCPDRRRISCSPSCVRAGGVEMELGGDPPRPGRRRARPWACSMRLAAILRELDPSAADPAAAAGGHRRALLLAPGDPDVRLPADAAAR